MERDFNLSTSKISSQVERHNRFRGLLGAPLVQQEPGKEQDSYVDDLLDSFCARVISDAVTAEHLHVLPCAGGIEDQPSLYWRYMVVVWNTKSRLEAEHMRGLKENIGR